MCSYSTMRILFFILLQLTGIYSTEEVSLENDITKHIDNWVKSIFTIGGPSIAKMILPIYDSKLKEFQRNISNQENNFHKKIIFQNIVFERPCGTDYGAEKAQQMIWKSSENKISVFFEELNFYIEMLVRTDMDNEKTSPEVYVRATFKNFTSTAVKSHTRDNGLNITYDLTCSRVDYWQQSIWIPRENLPDDDKDRLDREIKLIIPDILRKTLNNNQKFIQDLDNVFQEFEKPRQQMISMLPDFLSNPHKYYYLIPRIPFLCFLLKRIVIHGLSNLESYKIHGRSEIFTHTLLVRNIQGSMTLDYRSEKEKALKLNFQIDCFILSKRDDTDCVHVRAKYYTITRRKTNTSLSGRQSEAIMNKLESVVASTLLPSAKIGQICDVEMPLEEIKISNSSDWETIKESYKGWIPFNDDRDIKK